jgi:MGT family glycosyltransferase
VTLGTVFPLESGDLLARLLAGLAALPVDVVATTGRDVDPAELGPQPPNVRLARWLPQADVLPTVDLVVHHGGSGTLAAAAAHGIPQVVIAMGADQLLNARRVTDLGIGRALHPVTVTPAEAADTVAAVLADPGAAAAAARLAGEYAALPDPAGAVPPLETLAGHH